MQNTTSCDDCGEPALIDTQKHCHTCGQRMSAPRIDWAFLRAEFRRGVLQMERGTLFTLKSLFLRPGHFLRDYLQGKRGGHVKPLPLLMFSAAATLLLAKFFLQGELIGDEMTGEVSAQLSKRTTEQALVAATVQAKFGQAQAWVNENITVFTLIMLPFEAAALKLAFRRAGALNYPEWLVITSYLTVQTFVIWSGVIILQRWYPAVEALLLPASIAIAVVTLVQLFSTLPKWKTVLRTLFGFLMLEILVIAVTFAAAIVLTLQVV